MFRALYWGYIRVILGLYRIMEKKMETTIIMGYIGTIAGSRLGGKGLVFRDLGFRV